MAIYHNQTALSVVTYNGIGLTELKFNGVTVWQALSSISVKSDTLPSEVVVGSPIDVSNLVIILRYRDNSTEEIKYADNSDKITIAVPSTSTVGTVNVRILYKGLTCNYKVRVIKRSLAYVLNADATTASCIGIGTVLDASIVVETEYNGVPVTNIAQDAFRDCTNLTSVTIPSSIKSIGKWAFNGCTSLTSASIANGVTSIGQGAFYGCASLTSITIPDSVTSIGQGAFSNCTSLTSITIPDSVTSFGSAMFNGCSNLASVKLPANITSLGGSTFNACRKLASVTIPDSVTSIGTWEFAGCASLTSVTIPSSIKSIGKWAFNGCTNLMSATISCAAPRLLSIATNAFGDCAKLTDIYVTWYEYEVEGASWGAENAVVHYPITEGLAYELSDDGTHAICTGIGTATEKNIVIASEYAGVPVTTIGFGAFSNCGNITYVFIPGSIKTIGASAFWNCESITLVRISNGVECINDQAFKNCEILESIEIPSSVWWIGEAFVGCSKLTDIYMDSPSWGAGHVSGAPWGAVNASIHYPS